MNEYIVHGTLYNNLIKILKDEHIDNNPPKNTMYFEKAPKQIFTQLVYKDIPYESNQNPFWFDAGIVLKKEILKDFPFYATKIGGYSNKFKDGLNKENSIIYGLGKLSRYPNLKKLKEVINNHKIPNFETLPINFTHSHEILFGRKIPIKKYCECIIIYKNDKFDYNKIKKICDKLNIPLKILDKNGINNFVDLIKID
jgi:hypothetical protein